MTIDSADSETKVVDDLDAIIESLDGPQGVLPVEAIQAARQHRQRIIPRLIQLIQRATDDARDGEPPESNSHFFALFLLLEFRAGEALPAILDAVALPGELPFDLFGDAIHEVLPKVVPTMAHDRLDDILPLIRNRDANQYVRWTLTCGLSRLVVAGLRQREEIVELLRGLLQEAVAGEDFDLITPLVSNLVDLYPEEAYEEIADAYQRRLVETFMIGLKDVDNKLAKGKEAALRWLGRHSPYLEDTIEELQHWAAFEKKDEPKAALTAPPPRPKSTWVGADPSALTTQPADLDPYDTPETVRGEGRRVGRNDPCPCGSGKKYKKCCGSASKRNA
jgi:hypothetical protein